jgi:hypothetical protein
MSREGLWIDVGKARQFSGQINGGIGQMQGLIESISALIGDIFWEGDDKLHFSNDWHGNFKPEAARATQSLQETSDEMLRRAHAQEQLSHQGY